MMVSQVPRPMWLALIPAAAFAALLAFFLAFRTLLIDIPVDVIDAFQKSGIGTLTALVLLLLQPFVCRMAAKRLRAAPSQVWWVFAGGVFSSLLLFFPALLLFME